MKGRFYLAWKTMTGPGKWFAVLCFAIGVAGLVLASKSYGAILTKRAQPCESLAELSQGQPETILNQVRQMEGVLNAGQLIESQGTLLWEEYSAEICLISVGADYLQGDWIQGDAYPETTAMPYLVVNEAALKAFQNSKKEHLPKDKEIDWLTQRVFWRLGEERTNVRICGILQDGKEEPWAYVSLSQRGVMGNENDSRDPSCTIWIRMENSEVQASLMSQLSGIGISLQDPGEEDSSLETGLYRKGAAGLVFLGVAGVVLYYQEKYRNLRDAAVYNRLYFMGVSKEMLNSVRWLRWGVTVGMGILIGVVAGVVIG